MTFVMPKLMPHQEIVKDWMVRTPKCAVFLVMGGGKSLTTLSALAEVRPNGHILVCAPLNIARSTWIEEIEKWGFPIRWKSLIVNERDKKLSKKAREALYEELWTQPPTMYFVNIDLVSNLIDSMPRRTINGVETIMWPFQTVILDESQTVKGATSSRFLALRNIAPATLRFIELSGTPTPNGLLDLWSQMYLLDGGLALGATIDDYRDRFFSADKIVNNRVVSWKLRPGAAEIIHGLVRHKMMSAENTNIPLPDVTIEDVDVVLPKDIAESYRDFTRDMVIELASPDENNPSTLTITADNRGILAGKQTQYASGTLYIDDEGNYVTVHEEKLAMADYLVKDNGGSPVIVAYRYRSEKQELLRYLKAAGHKVESFDGSRSMIKRWNDGAIPVMLLQPASAGHGLNLQMGGHTLIWYTLPESLEHYLQAMSRLIRIGQAHAVRILRLITKGTRDARQPIILAGKEAVQRALIDAVTIGDQPAADAAAQVSRAAQAAADAGLNSAAAVAAYESELDRAAKEALADLNASRVAELQVA